MGAPVRTPQLTLKGWKAILCAQAAPYDWTRKGGDIPGPDAPDDLNRIVPGFDGTDAGGEVTYFHYDPTPPGEHTGPFPVGTKIIDSEGNVVATLGESTPVDDEGTWTAPLIPLPGTDFGIVS